MAKPDLEAISKSLVELVKPGMLPKELIKAAKKAHPSASKKDLVRAAFYAVIANATSSDAKFSALHDFAIVERADDEGTPSLQ